MTDSFELELTDMAHGGDALGRHEGRVIFVPYAIPGERVRARITDDRERYAFAEVVEVLSPSPDRREPPCPHFGRGKCGGCQWQHIGYKRQLAAKQRVMQDQLQRIGRFDDPPVQPTIPSVAEWGYRSHSSFTVREDGRLGFYSDNGERIVPVDECHILQPALMDLYEQLDLKADTLARVKFQAGTNPDDRMLILSTSDDLAPNIEVDFPLSVNLLLSDNEPVNLIGSPQVTYRVFERDFRVTAGGFFQINAPMAEVLVEQVLERLALDGDENVLDLYSGVGLFTAFVAERAGLVISVESYPPAVTDAEVNLAEFQNVDLVEGPVEAVLADLEGPVDAVVLDPPRAGLDVAVVDALARLAPQIIVYVSCDPASFARDAKRLTRQGFALKDVQPVDLFPQTYHIESVATLTRE